MKVGCTVQSTKCQERKLLWCSIEFLHLNWCVEVFFELSLWAVTIWKANGLGKTGTTSFVFNFLLFISGNDIQPKRDLSRFVRWPKYVRLQRQKSALMRRLKVPPPINQFSQTLDRQTGKYRNVEQQPTQSPSCLTSGNQRSWKVHFSQKKVVNNTIEIMCQSFRQ